MSSIAFPKLVFASISMDIVLISNGVYVIANVIIIDPTYFLSYHFLSSGNVTIIIQS
jgi:hypothetical protein